MTNTQDGKHRVSKTLWTVYCFFLAASIFIIGRIIFLQYAWEPDQKTLKYFTPENRQETINPERGTITDCNGQILAISTPLYTIHMDCHIMYSQESGSMFYSIQCSCNITCNSIINIFAYCIS